MQLASVSLPNLHLISNEQQLDFSLGGSLQLRCPDGVELPVTSNDLLKLVTEKHLWIARTGSCYLHLYISMQGEPVSERDHIAKLVEWVRDCEIWSRVGVRLLNQGRGAAESPGQVSFSIQHPDLSSTLVTQKDAFTAEFESVTCHINLSPKRDEPFVEKRSLKRKRPEQHNECIRTQQSDDASSDDEHLAHLTLDDQRAIDAFIQSLNTMPAQQDRGKQIQKACGSDFTSERIEFLDRFKQLFHIALEILVLGSRKKHRGIATVDCTRAEYLTQLAPAVFYMPYLKSISDRASLLPIIATSLARMKTAESPSLRQKAASFAAPVMSVKSDYSDRVIRGIEKSTWDVLVSTIKMPARPRQGGYDVKGVAPNTEPRPEIIPPLAIEQEERYDVTLNATPSGTKGQTDTHVVQQSFLQQRNPQCLESQQHSLSEMQASNTALLTGPHYFYTQAGLNSVFSPFGMNNKLSMDGGAYEHQSAAEAIVWNHDPWPTDIGSLTFDEWLCPSESGELGHLVSSI
ncbi:hypothetical protein V8C42DRAFT_308294 [Trichoderma barbatum]